MQNLFELGSDPFSIHFLADYKLFEKCIYIGNTYVILVYIYC